MNKFEDNFYSWWLRSNIRDAYWWVMHRVSPRHRYHVIRTGLKPGYYDTDTQILHGCMNLLVEFVEREHEGEVKLQEWINTLIDPNQPDDYGSKDAMIRQGTELQEVLTIYRWWKYQWPDDYKHSDVLLDLVYGNGNYFSREPTEEGNFKLVEKPQTPEQLFNRDWHDAFEEKIDREEQEMLIRLMKVRCGLWT